MQLLKTFLKISNTLVPFRDFVYIAQLEEYRIDRFYKWACRFFFRRNIEKREHLVWTLRARLLLLVSVVLWITGIVGAYSMAGISGALVAVVLLSLGTPLIVGIALYLLIPFVAWAHRHAVGVATRRVALYKNLTVVLIAGSFGKTTTKHFLYELIRLHKKTQMTPGTINTTVGVAQWIIRSLRDDTEVLLLEADAYAVGDIAEIAHMAPPGVAIITALGDQHMERLKTRETLVHATAEAFTESLPTAVCIAPASVHAEIADVGTRIRIVSDVLVHADEESLVVQHALPIRQSLRLAVCAAYALGVPNTFFKDVLANPPVPERRGVYTILHGYECLDYSFNVTLTTAHEALKDAQARAQKAHKKLLVVTGGITEAQDTYTENQELGARCGEYADHTIVIETMFTSDVRLGLGTKPHSTVSDVAPYIPRSLQNFNPQEWFILLLPELGDLYR